MGESVTPATKRLRFKEDWIGDDALDCRRIVRIARERGFTMTPEEAWAIWKIASIAWMDGWLCLPKSDDEVWERILRYAEEEPDDNA